MSSSSSSSTGNSIPPVDYSQYFKKGKFILRVGQFNVLNLVKENTVFYGYSKYTTQQMDQKVKWVSEQLDKMDAGIVAFQEIFHDEALNRVIQNTNGLKGAEVVVFDANGSGPRVALASVFPVKEKKSIKDFPKESILTIDGTSLPITTFSRPILRVGIEIPLDPNCKKSKMITVFVCHAKSKRPIVPDALRHDQKAKAVGHALSLVTRAAESAALRCILVDELDSNPDRPIIVCGDLNDTLHSVTTSIITGTRPWKTLPHAQKQIIWDKLLYSTNEVQVRNSDRDVTYSHIHNGRYEVLDHILVSPHFARSNPKHMGYVQYIQIFNDHLLDDTLSDEKKSKIQSDHGQIVAHIKIYT